MRLFRSLAVPMGEALKWAPPLVAGTTHGAGDAVLLHSGTTGRARITGNSESEYFGVEAHSEDGGIELLVNSTDPYTGTVPLPRTPSLVVVHASGAGTSRCPDRPFSQPSLGRLAVHRRSCRTHVDPHRCRSSTAWRRHTCPGAGDRLRGGVRAHGRAA